MPATSRVQAPDGATSLSIGYLKAQGSAAWAMLQTGLAIFAVFIIVRYCVRRAYWWWLGSVAARRLSRPQGLQEELVGNAPRWLIDEKSRETTTCIAGPMKAQDKAASTAEGAPTDSNGKTSDLLTFNSDWESGAASLPRQIAARLPPAPPLTPPELSTAVFTIEGAPHRHDSFIHQPNPDYMSSTSSSFFQTTSEFPSRTRRRSYNRTLPVGIPMPRQSSSLSDADSADLAFSPSSYPPTSPLLPPPPPGASRADDVIQGRREVDVKGEIISVLDGEGAGWTRHTRVYGGGVCLACAASGKEHGGGFYGATVTPEEMR